MIGIPSRDPHHATHETGGSDAIVHLSGAVIDSGFVANGFIDPHLINKRIDKRVEVFNDLTPWIFTPNWDNADVGRMQEASGNISFANPTGSPTPSQGYTLKLRTTNQRSIAWTGTLWRAGLDFALPLLTTGGGKWDYLFFMWESVDGRIDLVGMARGLG